jgi:hypothetical protein
MPRACVFCGRTPVTREHLWPDWMRRAYGAEGAYPHDVSEEVDGASVNEREWNQPPFSLTVRAVCGSCNSGWMSTIETQAKPLLERLLQYQGRRLHRREQRILASWALLKAIVMDQTHADRQIVFDSHRQYLFEHHEPPPKRLWIWLAAYNAELVYHYAYQGLLLAPIGSDEKPSKPTAYIVTFTAGPLAVQLAGSELENLSFDDVVYPQLDVAGIWPSSPSVEYAQRTLMTTRTLRAFSEALHADIDRRATSWEPRLGPN